MSYFTTQIGPCSTIARHALLGLIRPKSNLPIFAVPALVPLSVRLPVFVEAGEVRGAR